MKLNIEQYNELKAVQDAFQQAQANLQRTMQLIGLDVNKPYIVSIAVDEIAQPVQPTPTLDA